MHSQWGAEANGRFSIMRIRFRLLDTLGQKPLFCQIIQLFVFVIKISYLFTFHKSAVCLHSYVSWLFTFSCLFTLCSKSNRTENWVLFQCVVLIIQQATESRNLQSSVNHFCYIGSYGFRDPSSFGNHFNWIRRRGESQQWYWTEALSFIDCMRFVPKCELLLATRQFHPSLLFWPARTIIAC